MAPTIRDGDRVLLRAVPVDRLRRGDVVVIAVRQAAVLHRIHRIHAGGLVETVGDGKLSGDGVFAPDHVLGVAVLAERSSSRVTLRSTLEFGVAAYLRGIALLARLRVAQWWRRAKVHRDMGGSRV